MEDFYEPLNATSSNTAGGLFANGLNIIYNAPIAVLFTISLAPLLIILATRLLSGYAFHNTRNSGTSGSVEMVPYWMPVIGHAFQLY